jgi:PKD repeat protein
MKLRRLFVLAALAAAYVLALAPGPASAAGCKTEYTGPTAAFTYSPGTPAAGSAVTFDASSSQPGGYTSYSYDAQQQTCAIADSGESPITSYTWNWGDGTANTTGSSATANHTFASPGTYNVSVTVSAGSAGSDSASSSVVTAWQVTLTEPAAPGFWTQALKRQTINLAATAAGPQPVQRMEFYVRNVKVGEDTTAPYSVSFNTASIADGPAGIYARAVGTGGNSGSSATREVKIDNTAPVFTLVQHPGAVVKPGQDTFRVRFTDDEYLYGNAQCWADSPSQPVGADLCIGAGVEKVFESNYAANLAEGEHTVYFRALDAAGNGTTGSANVRVDGTAPDTSIASGPADGSSSTDSAASFGLGASEPGSTFRCRLYPDGSAAPAFGACSGASSHAVSGLAPGPYRFEAVAVDQAGNEDASPAGRTFTVVAPSSGGPNGGGTQTGGQTGGQLGGQPATTGGQGGVVAGGKAPVKKAGKCSTLRGKKRAACVKRSCAKLKKKKDGRKRYKTCVKAVTRKA